MPGLEHRPVASFTLMDSPSGRWHQPDLGQPVVYDVAAAGDPTLGPDATFGALDAAFAAWTNVEGATIVLQRGGNADPAPLICDGKSQILFGDPFDEMPRPQACSGVLAVGGYCTLGQGAVETDLVNGVRFRRIAEGNITFNSGFGSCSFWNATNLAEVATHEIGHTIGIGHSSERDDEPMPALKDATMYYRAHFDGRGGSVRPDDVAAVRFIYPGAVPAIADADGDGVPDDVDNCPGNDPQLGMANPSQTDTDGDGIGDLCDECPLEPAVDGVQSCQPILDSHLEIVAVGLHASLVWRGLIDLPSDADIEHARAVLTSGEGVLVDTSNPVPAALRHAGRSRSRLVFRSEGAVVKLLRQRSGSYSVRAVMRDVPLGTAGMPVVSASLQVGASTFATSLSCPPRSGRRFTCRG
jgi:hypothetical protein